MFEYCVLQRFVLFMFFLICDYVISMLGNYLIVMCDVLFSFYFNFYSIMLIVL